MTMTLYKFPASTCSLKVRITLCEKEFNCLDHIKPWSNRTLNARIS